MQLRMESETSSIALMNSDLKMFRIGSYAMVAAFGFGLVTRLLFVIPQWVSRSPMALERELPKIRSRSIPKGPSRRAGSLGPHRHYGPRHDFHRDCAITGPRSGRVLCRHWTARGAESGDSLRCDCRMDPHQAP